ncbi:L-glutamate gamma-semialdehyde dehydrogenase [Barrientosiimonas marina]|uniref:1-pyrroline-5-carboxylate dehydrogenase n=1 Tax=Lentibacillus kimchii TaxID=1542911 RepID=A0ABW2UUT4_9BACI
MVLPYAHETETDFSDKQNYADYEAALRKVESQLGQDYPLVIGGERVYTDNKLTSVNPANTEQVIGRASMATKEHVEQAMESAKEAFKTWKKWTPEERAEVLFKAAAISRRHKHELSALMSFEANKPWGQADGDTAEAIDFMEYYGRQMVRLGQGREVNDRTDENNTFFYQPIGPGVAIPPWNFAYAIVTGTTVAPIVAGNPVLMKPSENTPVIAYQLIRILEEAGLPKGVVNFIPGDPAEIGDYLVDHIDTQFINFTGSRATGTRIYERAAVVHEGQAHLKRVVAEMGGKDTIVVDNDADLDLAAQSIVDSTFGFQGQKCSACSRAIVHQDVYDEVLAKTAEKAKSYTVGNPGEENVGMGAVVNQKQFDRIKDYIEIGKQEGELVFGGETDDSKGYHVYPTIFKDLDPQSRIMQEEIFGPVVGFTRAKDFDELMDIANNTDYALTGAVISKNRAHLNRARYEFEVGNLYFNRGCTGSIVGYQPFGGYKMSGTNAKAGGPDYLLNFLNPKTVTETW